MEVPEVPKATVIRGDVLLRYLSRMVNRLLAVQYPYLQQQLTRTSLVFIPDTAEGAMFEMPGLTDVSVQASRQGTAVKKRLPTEGDGDLLGFPLIHVGMRVAFRVGDVHLTIGRQERTLVLSPSAHANFELVYRAGTPHVEDYLDCLSRSQNVSVATATEDEARRLLPA